MSEPTTINYCSLADERALPAKLGQVVLCAKPWLDYCSVKVRSEGIDACDLVPADVVGAKIGAAKPGVPAAFVAGRVPHRRGVRAGAGAGRGSLGEAAPVVLVS